MTRLRRLVHVFLFGWEGERHRYYSDLDLFARAYRRMARLIGEALLPPLTSIAAAAKQVVEAFSAIDQAVKTERRR